MNFYQWFQINRGSKNGNRAKIRNLSLNPSLGRQNGIIRAKKHRNYPLLIKNTGPRGG